jgi:quercetin dioxygenase-like cupin family protein
MGRYKVTDLLKLPDEGEETATDMLIKARARDMGGDWSVMQGTIGSKKLLSPHTHKFEDQAVWVINGELTFEVDGEDGLTFKAPAGSYVQKPRGVKHAFWNSTDEEVRYLELSGREGFEGFVDSQKNGTQEATIKSEKDWGIYWDFCDIARLMEDNNLDGLAMSDGGDVSEHPDLPEKVKKFLTKFQK